MVKISLDRFHSSQWIQFAKYFNIDISKYVENDYVVDYEGMFKEITNKIGHENKFFDMVRNSHFTSDYATIGSPVSELRRFFLRKH